MDIQPITKYGVTLRPLTHDKIEMVRQWRNDPKISQYMEFRDEITPEMQEKWFRKISASGRDFYFIIEYNGDEVGLINMKDFDERMTEGEAGVFIYVDRYLNTDIAYRAHIAMFDYFFENRGLEKFISHILKSNARAQRFAQFLGAKICNNQEGVENQRYETTKEEYYNNSNRQRFIKREKSKCQINNKHN